MEISELGNVSLLKTATEQADNYSDTSPLPRRRLAHGDFVHQKDSVSQQRVGAKVSTFFGTRPKNITQSNLAGTSSSNIITSQQNVAVNSTSSKSKGSKKKTPTLSTKTKTPTAAAKAKTAKADDICKDADNFESPSESITCLEYSGRSRTTTLAEAPLDLFHLKFLREIVEILVPETNRYHAQAVAKGREKTKLPSNDVVIEEMYAFLGIVIAMGIITLPEIKYYWCKSPILNVPWFPSVFSRNCFEQILCNLHLAEMISSPQEMTPITNSTS